MGTQDPPSKNEGGAPIDGVQCVVMEPKAPASEGGRYKSWAGLRDVA